MLSYLNPFRFWPTLPVWPRLFSYFLAGVAVYVVIRLLEIGTLLRRIKRLTIAELAPPQVLTSRSAALRLENIRQVLLFSFYLFAVMFFAFQLPNAFFVFGNDHRSGDSIVLEQLGFAFSYSADVMLVLLSLYSFQWLVSARMARVTRKLFRPD